MNAWPSDREIVGSASKPQHPGHSRRGSLRQIKVSSDTHRRALARLASEILYLSARSDIIQKPLPFFFLGSVVPEERDLLDVRQRELIDEERRKRRVQWLRARLNGRKQYTNGGQK
ncbi:hypothetical protein PGT21_003591 [Puccinia graminis f. sp. tritici]|uniref:Uncharacterized protein n=1 Tax=Puccinia graminis f. sp. tritici TaxID=56615 RepID=A0A5B0PCL4_PUCGR|nr:hypothetical protein PGT21_003591 [Puccinia graminis f. sp. tritici]